MPQVASPRVLVVDDNPVNALVTSRRVALAGGEPVVVRGADQVEGALAAQTMALVVLDGGRPEHRECAARLRQAHPQLAVVHGPIADTELRAALERARPSASASPAATGVVLVDRRRLVHNVGDDERAADQVLSAFLAQADDSLDSLRGACASGELPAVARVAHRLKGSLLWIGADQAAREAASLEARVNAGDTDGVRTALARVEKEVLAVVADIRAQTAF